MRIGEVLTLPVFVGAQSVKHRELTHGVRLA